MREKYGNYFRWAITIISVIAFGILFFFFIFRLGDVIAFLSKVIGILTPIILGAVIAYLLNPLVKQFNKWFIAFFSFCNIPPKVSRFIAKTLSILLALGLLLTGITLLLYLVIPELYSSILKLAGDFRSYINIIYDWVNGHLENNPELLSYVKTYLESFTTLVYDWVNNKLLFQMQSLMSGLTLGIFGVAKLATNVFVGIIVSIYLLVSKDRFVGQIKKLLYTLGSPERVNVFLSITRQVDKIFGGFISGKIIDSAIIGILCFIGVSILKMPYPLLLSVIVGVTNVIPFFGPYIGAIPCAFLVLLVSPSKCLIFLIFILALQQLDGNLIGPAILGDSTGLSPFWVVVSILVGGGLFGFFGMLLGVPTFAVFYYLVKTFSEYHLKKKGLPTSSLAYCRLESIDPDTGTFIFLKKHTSKRKTQNFGLMEALEKASSGAKRDKKPSSEKSNSSDTPPDNT